MHLSAVRARLLSTLVISALVATSAAVLAPDASAATAPAVSLLSSHDGKVSGGTTLTVNGTGFASGAAVLFGTTAGTGVRIVSAKQLTVLVPAHAAGVVDVRVRQGTLASAITTADRYTYHAPPAITAITPASGPAAGGTAVTIAGTGFEAVTGVTSGGAPVASFRVVSTSSITVTTAAHAGGAASVVVTGTYGSSAAGSQATFTYLDTPEGGPVTGLSVSQTDSGLTLHWTRPSDTDFAGVDVYRSTGTVPAATTATASVARVAGNAATFSDAGLSAGTTYTYSVVARDASGNTAAPASITSTTLLGPEANVAGDPMPPIVYVHGYYSNASACNRSVTDEMYGPILTEYYAGVPAADLHTVAFYDCDTGGDSIIGYGPGNASYFGTTADDANTDLRHYAYELAWYVYDNFTIHGRSVDLVGASMGGMLITWALQRVAAQDSMFPPSLAVSAVVTFSTPFAGASVGCPADFECAQLTPDSDLTRAVVAAGTPQSDHIRWLTVGSSAGCDLVPASSSLALSGVTYRVDYSNPCYDHGGYLSDFSSALDASATVNGEPTTTGWHSLALMQSVLAAGPRG